MTTQRIAEIKRIFVSRLDVLQHVLDLGAKHFADPGDYMGKQLAGDMLPFSAQVALACNQPRGFALWCAGKPVENLGAGSTETPEQARDVIARTREMVEAIDADDAKLDEVKRVGLGPGLHCELPGHQYVADYLMPNLYFHICMAYANLRHLGVPIGKADYMRFLAPLARSD